MCPLRRRTPAATWSSDGAVPSDVLEEATQQDVQLRVRPPHPGPKTAPAGRDPAAFAPERADPRALSAAEPTSRVAPRQTSKAKRRQLISRASSVASAACIVCPTSASTESVRYSCTSSVLLEPLPARSQRAACLSPARNRRMRECQPRSDRGRRAHGGVGAVVFAAGHEHHGSVPGRRQPQVGAPVRRSGSAARVARLPSLIESARSSKKSAHASGRERRRGKR